MKTIKGKSKGKKLLSIVLITFVTTCGVLVILGIVAEDYSRDPVSATPQPTLTELPSFNPEEWDLTFLDSLQYEWVEMAGEEDETSLMTRVLMGVELQNRSEAAGMIVRNSFTLLDAAGEALGTYQMSPYTPLPSKTVEPGERLQGDILFEIPGASLRLEDLSLVFQILYAGRMQELHKSAPQPSELRRLDLRQAIAEGLVDIEVFGESLESMDIRLKPKLEPELELTYEVTILPGTMFLAPTGSLQNMVVRYGHSVMVRPIYELSLDLEFDLDISVACANMHLDGPEGGEVYTMSMDEPQEDMTKLLAEPSFLSQNFRIQQFAIWTITDNPARDSYVRLGTFGIGSGPSDEEIGLIKQMFTNAGIPLDAYQALK